MYSALAKLFLLFLPTLVLAQPGDCNGPTYAQIITDAAGQDIRLTAVIPYPGGSGDLLFGGTSGGHLWLLRSGRDGSERWRQRITTGSESTELSTLNGLVVDPEGFIAGVGSTYNGNAERGYLFRYDPRTELLAYFRQPNLQSEFTGLQVSGPDYVITGTRRGQPEPVFASAYYQQVRRSDGQPSGPDHLYDFLGEEAILDAQLLPDGDLLTVGNTTLLGGAGKIRAAFSRIAPDGTVRWSYAGPVPQSARGKLFAYDVEVVGQQAYVLHWGNIGQITGGLNTTIEISSIDLVTGEHRRTTTYDLTDFNGEQGLELVAVADGFLVYGFSLIGRRYPWIMKVSTAGAVQWAKSYELPGNATLYQRANDALLADDEGIVALATYNFPDGRPRAGLVLRLEENGELRDGCLNVRDLAVTESNVFPAVWTEINHEASSLGLSWTDSPAAISSVELVLTDDCDRSCESCDVRSFRQLVVCRGESAVLAGTAQDQAGVYTDTLPGPEPGCDSLVLTELIVSDGPRVDYRVDRACNLARAQVQVVVTEGQAPYAVAWSVSGASGLRAELETGTYQITVTDAAGCFPKVIDVIVPAGNGTPLEYVATPPACPGDSTGSIALRPAGRGSLRLLSVNGQFRPPTPPVADALADLPAGEYAVTIRDSTGCEVFRQVTLPRPAPASVRITGNARPRLGDETTLIAQSPDAASFLEYRWRATDSLSCTDCPLTRLRPTGPTVVHLSARTEAGCLVADSLRFEVLEDAPRIYLPTAFSPNGDGLNDSWRPGVGPEVDLVETCVVYDRWGQQVWALGAAADDWWDGRGASPGTYVYHLTARLISGRRIERSGEVLLLR